MSYGGRELSELNSSELSEVSGGVMATEVIRLRDPCTDPPPPTPIPMPYPCQRSGGFSIAVTQRYDRNEQCAGRVEPVANFANCNWWVSLSRHPPTHPRRACALPDGRLSKILSSPLKKIFLFSGDPKSVQNSSPSRPEEGRWPSSRTLGRVAVDAAASARKVIAGRFFRERSTARRRTTLTRTAKPCGPGTRCWCQVGGGFA